MHIKDFQHITNRQIETCLNILGIKREEYAGDIDTLHNFKVAANLEGKTLRQAVTGMMSKHTVSVYDMANSDHVFSEAEWDEKITDHINYLLLLKAVLMEEEAERSEQQHLPFPNHA